MSKPFGLIIAIVLGILAGIAWTRTETLATEALSTQIDGAPYPDPSPSPDPYPPPAGSDADPIPMECHILKSQSFPPWPWKYESGKYPVCYVRIHDLYGIWGFNKDSCKYGPDGARCVSGMWSSGSKMTIDGPRQPDAVDIFVNRLRWLPRILR